jgi:hypothetical protein
MRLILAILVSSVTLGGQDDDLVTRMNKFARTYNSFTQNYRQGIFDLKLAEKLSKEWREVEKSEDWPKGN